jgi:5-methylcytosine-specific restriction endonuclease McrA
MADKQDIIKMIELYQSGSTLKEVGAKFGVYRKMVSKILKENGVEIIRRRNNFVTKNKLYDLYVNQELPSREIANRLGFKDHKSVTTWLRKYNIPIRHKNYFTDKRRKQLSDIMKVNSSFVTDPPMRKPEVVAKYRETAKKTGAHRGPNNWNWKGGITSANQKARRSIENEEFRKIVFERDNYTCQICDDNKKPLEANHIKLFSEKKELRFEPSNGITLCKDCHQSIRGKEHELEGIFTAIVSSKHISKKKIQKIKDEIMSKIYLYRDKDWLFHNYVDKKRKISDLARECKVDQGTINTWIHKFKIPLNEVDETGVVDAYVDGFSIERIQNEFHLAPKSVYDILEKNDIPLRHIQIEKERKEKIKLLKIDYANGMSKRELKKKYKMGGDTIVKILGYDNK